MFGQKRSPQVQEALDAAAEEIAVAIEKLSARSGASDDLLTERVDAVATLSVALSNILRAGR